MLDIQQKMKNSFFALLGMPSTAMGFALSIQISALSWILSTKYGLDIHEVGIVWAAGPIAGIVAQPLVGALSDKVWFWGGRRRPFIIIGGMLTSLMLLALPNIEIIQKAISAGPESLMAIAIIIALTLDLSINVSMNPTRSIIADVTDLNNRTKGFTWMQTISGTFGVLAYAIGAFLGNYELIYFGVFLVLAFSIIPCFFIEEPRILKNEGDKPADSKASSSFKDIIIVLLPLWGFLLYGIYVICSKLIGFEIGGNIVEFTCAIITVAAGTFVLLSKKKNPHREFQKVMLAHAFTWWGVQTMFIYTFAYAKSNIMGLTPDAILTDSQNFTIGQISSFTFLILNVIGALLPVLVLNGMANKIGKVKTHTISIFIMAIGYLSILLFGHTALALYILICIVGVGWASTISLSFAIMSERVDQVKMGFYMGIFNLSVVLPQLVASFKMGELINNAGNKNIIFIICSLTLAISGILWLTVKECKKNV